MVESVNLLVNSNGTLVLSEVCIKQDQCSYGSWLCTNGQLSEGMVQLICAVFRSAKLRQQAVSQWVV